MAQEWYYTKDGERQGPITSQHLKQLAASGKLQPSDLVWNSEMDDWKPAKSVRGLFQATSQPKVTKPPPVPSQSKPSAPAPSVPANEPTSFPNDQPGLLKSAKTKFANLSTPQKITYGVLGGMGAFFFLCMGTCGLFGLIGGGFDEVRQVARDAHKEDRENQASTPDQSDEPKLPVFSEGLAIVKKEGVWCVVDEEMATLGEVGANELASFRPFSNGRAVFFIHAGDYPPDSGGYSAPRIYYGAIDRKGTVIIPPEFTLLSDFSDDHRAVVSKGRFPDEEFGIIDLDGHFILPLTNQYTIGGLSGFDNLHGEVGFSEGLVYFCRKGEEMAGGGFLDTAGRIAIPAEEMEIPSAMGSPGIFSEGLAAIQRGQTDAELRSGFSSAGAMKIGYIDKAGKQVIKPQFSVARVFSEGLAAVQREFGDKWGYVDKTGKMVIDPKFDSASTFKDGKASVTFDGNEKVIDRTGRIVK